MLKKILSFLFAVAIILQAAAIGGLAHWLNKQYKVSEMNYLDGSSSSDLLVDRQNQIWVAYYDNLRVYQGGQLKDTITQQDLSFHAALLALDLQGRVWAFPSETAQGMAVYDGHGWTHMDGPGDFYTWDAGVDSKGRVWLGTGDGLHVYENGKWKQFNTSNSPLPDDWVSMLAFDGQGQVWMVSEQGMAVTDGVNWKTFQDTILNGKTIQDIDIDRNDNVWVGTTDGLFFFNGSEWSVYTPENSGMESVDIAQVAVDQQNRVWFAASQWGRTVTVFDGITWKYLYGKGYWSDIDAGIDGNIYLNDNGVRKVAAGDTRLANRFVNDLMTLIDYGFFTYVTIFLVGAWLMIILGAWGIGIGLLGGGIIYVGILLFSPHLIPSLNIGTYVTIGGVLGGLVGYFFKRRGKNHADLWGGAIGCGLTFLIAACLLAGLLFLSLFTQ